MSKRIKKVKETFIDPNVLLNMDFGEFGKVESVFITEIGHPLPEKKKELNRRMKLPAFDPDRIIKLNIDDKKNNGDASFTVGWPL